MTRKLPKRCDSAYADLCSIDWTKLETAIADALPGAPKTVKERIDAVIGLTLAAFLLIGEYLS